jgi:hypothetical protein
MCPEPVVLTITEEGWTPRDEKGFCLTHVVGALMAYENLMRDKKEKQKMSAQRMANLAQARHVKVHAKGDSTYGGSFWYCKTTMCRSAAHRVDRRKHDEGTCQCAKRCRYA